MLAGAVEGRGPDEGARLRPTTEIAFHLASLHHVGVPRRQARGAVTAMVVAAAMVMFGAGPAVAAPQLTLSPASGPPGTEFTVTGTGFPATSIDIHWGRQDGPHLASTTGPEFSVTAYVPDAPANSHQVFAVMRNGNAVSTSTAPFQVTAGEVVTTTTSTVLEPVTTTTVAPARSTGAAPAAGAARGTSGVGGGAEDLADTGGGTTNGGTGTGAAGSSATTTTAAAAAGAPTTVPDTQAPPVLPAAPAGLPADALPAPSGDQNDAESALAQQPTSQSSGAVSNPALLALGLGMVFCGGAFLAIRNRQRASG